MGIEVGKAPDTPEKEPEMQDTPPCLYPLKKPDASIRIRLFLAFLLYSKCCVSKLDATGIELWKNTVRSCAS